MIMEVANWWKRLMELCFILTLLRDRTGVSQKHLKFQHRAEHHVQLISCYASGLELYKDF